MKGLIILLVGFVSSLFLCSDLWAQQTICNDPCCPIHGSGMAVQVPLGSGGWRAASPPNTRAISPPRAQQQLSRGKLQPLMPPSACEPVAPPIILPEPGPTPPPVILPEPGPIPPPTDPVTCTVECPHEPCEYDATTINEILALGRQNSTKLDQLLEYGKAAPTAAQISRDHTRIEQLIAGAVTRLGEDHKQIQQDIRNLRISPGGDQECPEVSEKLIVINAQIAKLVEQLTELTVLVLALQRDDGPVTCDPSEEFQAVLAIILTRLDKLSEEHDVEKEPCEINLTVDTPTFLEPDYIDMSLIWAQQKAAGFKHAVLVVDTKSTSWVQLGQAYSAARAKFPPLSLYDVRSKNVDVKTLPQLVVYPKEGEPRVLSDPTEVVEELTRLAQLP